MLGYQRGTLVQGPRTQVGKAEEGDSYRRL